MEFYNTVTSESTEIKDTTSYSDIKTSIDFSYISNILETTLGIEDAKYEHQNSFVEPELESGSESQGEYEYINIPELSP